MLSGYGACNRLPGSRGLVLCPFGGCSYPAQHGPPSSLEPAACLVTAHISALGVSCLPDLLGSRSVAKSFLENDKVKNAEGEFLWEGFWEKNETPFPYKV